MKTLLEVWKNLKLPAILIMVMIVFIGCDKDDEPTKPSLIGHWYWSDTDSLGWEYIKLEFIFDDNETFYANFNYPFGKPDEITGTYKVISNKIEFTPNQDPDDPNWTITIGNDNEYLYDTGKDRNGDYLILYDIEENKELVLLQMKYRRK